MNDAKIMEDVIENDVNLRELIKPDDILIADRGFRDCVKIVKQRIKINVIIPPCTIYSITQLMGWESGCNRCEFIYI